MNSFLSHKHPPQKAQKTAVLVLGLLCQSWLLFSSSGNTAQTYLYRHEQRHHYKLCVCVCVCVCTHARVCVCVCVCVAEYEMVCMERSCAVSGAVKTSTIMTFSYKVISGNPSNL